MFITSIIIVFAITIYALFLPWYYVIFHKQFFIENALESYTPQYPPILLSDTVKLENFFSQPFITFTRTLDIYMGIVIVITLQQL